MTREAFARTACKAAVFFFGSSVSTSTLFFLGQYPLIDRILEIQPVPLWDMHVCMYMCLRAVCHSAACARCSRRTRVCRL